MKTARQRAEEFLGDRHLEKLLADDPEYVQELLDALELSFKEHARDQRHLCAEEALNVGDMMDTSAVHNMMMNTKKPGE